MDTMKPVRILFVCLGNICRSPLAEGVMRELASRNGYGDVVSVDSAGIGAWHIGHSPDRRSIAVAKAHGIDISPLRGRQIDAADLAAFDLILGMDSRNVAELRGLASPETARKVHLFMAFATGRSDDVPDPYYETADAFEALYQMLEAGCSSLLAKLVRPS
ncbi:low molecular weight protein-tyrosine-phosphatase YfkJ [Sinorhizobium americanum]|uniref:protein-tyrosine-phosphatase n=2 Tax=Sinorhizobium americanum TaxID=194963 RepID=A0A1L3LRZ4_9HYPH|nr:low molecular weight protein-tyrosine-phosphatase YfkJ [Sinorhizobium americanum]